MVKLVCAIVGVAGSAFPVDIDAGQLVGDLKKAIKVEKPNDLKDVDADKLQLSLAKAEGGAWLTDDDQAALDLEDGKVHEDIQALIDGEKMKATRTLQHWLFEKNKMPQPSTGQIHVLVVVVPTQQQAASIKKQLRYKGMSTEASCRKFLDALAQNLATLYDFECSYGDVATIGDVFSAVKNDEWGFRLKRGRQLTSEPLPSFFTEDEWKDLKDLNWRTNRRIHDGKVPTTRKGKSYVILPHAIFSDDRVDRYKTIATRASVVFEATEFEVKDEDEFSGSSRSSSGRLDIA